MDDGRLVIYCLVPERLEGELLGDMRAHYASDDRVHVIVDHRKGERRASARGGLPSRSAEEDLEERRSGRDRRRPVLPRWFDQLPAPLAARADGVTFVQRMLPVSGGLSAMEVGEIVAQIRAGNPEAPTELYWRVYERVHSRLCVLLGDASAADKAAPTAFGRILDAIEADENAARRFDRLLYTAVDAAFGQPQQAAGGDGGEAGPGGKETLAIRDPTLDEPVQVKERDPRWFQRGMTERDRVMRLAREHVIAVEHIGSTGIPAIPARPIVDLLVGVHRMQEPPGLRSALLELGYARCGTGGVAGRAYYRRRGVLGYDVHVVRYDSPMWRDAIKLRDHLRQNPIDAARWGHAKREAARASGHSLVRYHELRATALQEIMKRASQTAQRAA